MGSDTSAANLPLRARDLLVRQRTQRVNALRGQAGSSGIGASRPLPCSPAKLVRIKGELLLSQDAPGAAAAAEDHFRQSLDWARQQGALSWELRAATSLTRLLRDQGRSATATGVLQPVYDRFTEGFETADLRSARALLDTLR